MNKAAARIFEAATETGLLSGWGGGRGAVRLLLRLDCGNRTLEKIKVLDDNVRSLESVWGRAQIWTNSRSRSLLRVSWGPKLEIPWALVH